MRQIHIFFSGQVQGVGFRAFTFQLAQILKLTGFVKNLPDGRVELLAQGKEENLQKLLEELKTNFQFKDAQISWNSTTRRFTSFEIEL